MSIQITCAQNGFILTEHHSIQPMIANNSEELISLLKPMLDGDYTTKVDSSDSTTQNSKQKAQPTQPTDTEKKATTSTPKKKRATKKKAESTKTDSPSEPEVKEPEVIKKEETPKASEVRSVDPSDETIMDWVRSVRRALDDEVFSLADVSTVMRIHMRLYSKDETLAVRNALGYAKNSEIPAEEVENVVRHFLTFVELPAEEE